MRSSISVWKRFALAGILLVLAPTVSAQAVCASYDPTALYSFKNRNSGFFMNANEENGTVSQQREQATFPAQDWHIEDGGGGTLRIRSELTGLYLEALGQTENSLVVQAPLDAGEDAQRWRISDGSDREEGFCRVESVRSGLYLRPLNGTRTEGEHMSLRTLNPQFTSFLWQIAPDGAEGFPVPPAPAGERLRDLAARNWNLRFGTETGGAYWRRTDADAYEAVLHREFAGTSPSQFKWRSIRPAPDVFDFGDADEVLRRQSAAGIAPYGTLVWYKDPGNRPGYWLNDDTPPPSQAQALLDDYLNQTIARYRGRVVRWEVNEATAPNPADGYRGGFWTEGLGVGAGGVPNYVRYALTRARALDPAAQLIYNEGFGYRINPARQALVFSLLQQLVAEGTPIDGVGTHFHVARTDEDFTAWFDHAARVAEELGLSVHITELDVRIPEPTQGNLAAQARVYAEVVERFLHLKNRGDLAVWGFTDKYSWLNPAADGSYNYPDLFDENLQPKPAYFAVQRVLAGGTARETDRNGLARIEAESHEATRGGKTAAVASALAELDAGDYAKYARTDFGAGAASVEVRYAAANPGDLVLEVLVDTDDGDPATWEAVARVTLAPTDAAGALATATLSRTLIGVQTVYLRATGTTGRVDAVDAFQFRAGTVAGEDGPTEDVPGVALRVFNISPNPAAARATVRFELAVASAVSVDVYDALGRRVVAVPARALGAGTQTVELDLSALPAGTYAARTVAMSDGATATATHRFTVAR